MSSVVTPIRYNQESREENYSQSRSLGITPNDTVMNYSNNRGSINIRGSIKGKKSKGPKVQLSYYQ